VEQKERSHRKDMEGVEQKEWSRVEQSGVEGAEQEWSRVEQSGAEWSRRRGATGRSGAWRK